MSAVATAGTLIAPSGAAAARALMNGIVTDGNVKVTALGSGDLTVLKDIIKSGATGAATLTLQANRNIVFNNGASAKLGGSASGTYTMVLDSDLDQDTVSGGAIQLNSGSVLNSNGGDIMLGGGAAPAVTPAIGTGALIEGVKLDNAQLLAGAGSISVRGTGLAGTSNAVGILISNGSAVEGAGAGTITLTGTGGSGASGNSGIRVTGSDSRITTTSAGSGAIALSGTGGAASATGNSGVVVDAAARVESLSTNATATIGITGTGGTGTDSNYGAAVDGAGSKITSAGGTITISGNRGNASGTDNYGIFVNNGGLVEYTGTGTGDQIVMTGGGAAAGSNNNHGIRVSNATIRTTQTGNISLTPTFDPSDFLWLDAGGTIDYVSPSVERMLGYKMPKYVMQIDAVTSYASHGAGNGGFCFSATAR